MSGAIDTMTTEDTALLDQMRQDEAADPAPEAAPAAPAPEAAPEAPEEPRHVPKQALDEERRRRKDLETEMQKLREQSAAEQARITERFNLLMEAAKQAAPAAPAPVQPVPEVPIPDVNVDPVGHFKAVAEKLQRELGAVRDEVQSGKTLAQQVSDAQKAQEQRAQLAQWGRAQEEAFARETPDYGAAMAHLLQTRHAMLEAAGYTDPAMRQQLIANDVGQIAQAALAQGANFAERLYRMASASGYRKADATATAASPVVDADARTATLERGRDLATTVGSTGTAPPPRMTPERIANMSEREFSAYYAKVSGDPAALRQLMGE